MPEQEKDENGQEEMPQAIYDEVYTNTLFSTIMEHFGDHIQKNYCMEYLKQIDKDKWVFKLTKKTQNN